VNTSRFKTDQPLPFGLSMLAGSGVIVMILALGYGVVAGAEVNSNAVGVVFLLGLALFVSGLIGWFAAVRPDAHFDDIDVPLYTGHDHGHDAHAEADQAALPATTEKAIEPAHH
jgi:hypothetical protein